jgi:arsenite methyltransferase
MNNDEIRQAVRETYARVAAAPGGATYAGGTAAATQPTEGASCCAPGDTTESHTCSPESTATGSCCAPQTEASADASTCGGSAPNATSLALGYSDSELGAIPEGANLGLGCGNPTAHATLKEGETVLDLGSGGGIDCFLASNAVGATGSVIGIDMTPQMISRARANAESGGYGNVDFRLGEIENMPVADGTVDAIISNCVINLSPDKPRVFREAFRALKPGGRVMVSDVVLTGELPEDVKNSVAAYAACIGGASHIDDYLVTIRDAGFTGVEVITKTDTGSGKLEGKISSVAVLAIKPS